MLVSKLIFTITILDIRNAKHIVHSTRFWLNVNGVIKADVLEISAEDFHNGNSGTWSDMQTKSIVYFLDGNDGNWADLLNQSVDDTVRNMYREIIRKIMNEDPVGLLQSGNFTFRRMENDRLVPVSGGAGASFGNLIDCFKSNHLGHNVMFVASLLVLE